MTPSDAALRGLALVARRTLWCGAAVLGLLSCGGGGGDGGGGPGGTATERPEGVYSGFTPVAGLSLDAALNWELASTGPGADGGVGVGADGDGGVGAGGDFGQFRNAQLTVRYPDGTLVGGGSARTDVTTGMVTIVPRKGYRGPLFLELRGGGGATYYEEGKDAFVDFPAGQLIRAIIPSIERNIGITPFSEAAYRLLTEGSTPERAANPAQPTPAEITAANGRVLGILNQHFPDKLRVDDIARLPFIKSPTIGNSIGIDPRGRYGLVNGAFSKQAAMFNPGRIAPTLDAVAQLGADLLDGVLDGMSGTQAAGSAAARTYDANTLTGELSSALAQQAYTFGTDDSQLALPKVLNFGNSRYEGYLFDASLTAKGEAIDTVVGWVGDNGKGRTIGQPFNKLPNEARVFSVIGNFGHGSLFFRANTPNSQPKTYVVGDNVNGELGVGDTVSTGGLAKEIVLPGVLTHAAGGFAHTVARMADGAVYAWGDNSLGQLGVGAATTNSTTPVHVTLPRGALAVAATTTASYALLDDGSVYAWGSSNGFGLLGDGNKTSVSATPTPITALSGIVQISARDNDVAVVRRDNAVLHWGSFPADPVAFTPGDVVTPYAGGTPLPTAIQGLPGGVAVRKIITEQGLFAALLADGTVYEWGVYFDITANDILRDLDATRVLSLPPLRDMMPGGFIGYGVRPFDRLTAMGVDYVGGMWKVRGRVAEEFDPANPTLQRRPLGQSPRPDCAFCHIPLSGWPLTPDPPTTNDVCQPPVDIHGGDSSSQTRAPRREHALQAPSGGFLIHAETQCEKCHNPNRQPPAPLFPNGWLTCVKPTNLPPRSTPVPPPVVTAACTIPAAHVFTAPGTVCASCHNSVIARPLNDPALNCAQPQSGTLPSIRTTASITRAVDDANATIAAGASTTDTTPTLQGTLSTGLLSGQALRVLRSGAAAGLATVSGTNWSFTDSAVGGDGLKAYTARVEAGPSFGPTSGSYSITIDTTAPTQTTSVQIADDIVGNLPNGGTTSDTTPRVSGTLSAALAAGETVRVLRGGLTIATVNATGTGWTFTEPSALAAGTYAYAARAVDAAGNAGSLSSSVSVTIVTNLPTASVTRAANDNNVTIAANGFTTDATPTVQGTVSAALSAGQLVQVLRDGTPVAPATVSATNWTFTEPVVVANGAHTYTARVEQGTVLSAVGAGYAFTIDTLPPTQTANVILIADDIIGALPAGGTTSDATPTISGTLSVALGANESLQMLRNGVVVSTANVSGATWTFTEPAPGLASGTYTYAARAADAAGNVSVAAGATRSVTIDTSFALAGASTTISTFNGVAIGGQDVTLATNSNTAPVLTGTTERPLIAAPPAPEVVRILRNGVSVGTATMGSQTTWTFTSAQLTEGTYTFQARIERSSTNFGKPSVSVTDPIDLTRPTQTVTSIVATSDVVPSTPIGVPGGPVDPTTNVIGSITNDPTPTLTIVLSAALGSGESLEMLRAIGTGGAQTVALLTAPSNCAPTGRCFQFSDDTKVSIPVPPARRTDPLTTPPNDSLPTQPFNYTARVRDAAGNLGANGILTFRLGYLDCNQGRATASSRSHTVLDFQLARTTNCAACHRTQPANTSPNGTPAGTLVAVPRGEAGTLPPATYWCRRPTSAQP